MNWAYGVTTVPSRAKTLLPNTLKSLANAGFDKPRLFVDGASDAWNYVGELSQDHFRDLLLRTTFRWPKIGAWGNWYLGLIELYIRNPIAELYAIFEDDILACKGLREYLEWCKFPEYGYWNLFTFMDNERVIEGEPEGCWFASSGIQKDGILHQCGRGALGLVFNRQGVQILLSSKHLSEKPAWADRRRTAHTDGAVCEAMNLAGYKEYIHNPSLLQHVGTESIIGNSVLPQALSFPRVDFDATTLR